MRRKKNNIKQAPPTAPIEILFETTWYSSFQHDLITKDNYHPLFLGSENLLTHCPTLFVFGGSALQQCLEHVFILKLSNILSSVRDEKTEKLNWEEITLDQRPLARQYPCLSYDRKNQNIYLFGGFGGAYLNDFWKFDLACRNWTQIETTGTAPVPRCGCSGYYAPSVGKFYVFGGFNGNYLNDFYELDLKTKEWQVLNYSHYIPPLTVLTQNTDTSKDYFTIFGGFTTTNYVFDMHHFDFNRKKWENSATNLLKSDGYSSYSKCITLRGKYNGIPNKNTFLILYHNNKGTIIYEYDKEEGELIKYKMPQNLESKFETLDAKFICEINEDTLLILENTELYLIEIRKLKAKDVDYFVNNLKERIQNFSDISFIN